MKRIALTTALLVALPATAGELVQTTDGSAYVGEVTAVSAESIEMEVDYPEPGKIEVPLAELTDRTIWRIRSDRLNRIDYRGWFELGEWAYERDMGVPALVAYRKAARDPGLAAKSNERMRLITDSLAQELFDRGETRWIEDRPASARHYFKMLLERYPDSPTATVARTRVERIDKALAKREADERKAEEAAALDTQLRKDLRRWNDDLEAIRSMLRRAARRRPSRMDSSRPVRTSRALEQAVAVLERAWDEAQDLGAAPDGVAPEAGRKLRATVRKRLVAAYVDTGYAYLMRPSLEQAEDWAVKASELDPESIEAAALYHRIIAARELSDFDDRFFSNDPSIARRLRR